MIKKVESAGIITKEEIEMRAQGCLIQFLPATITVRVDDVYREEDRTVTQKHQPDLVDEKMRYIKSIIQQQILQAQILSHRLVF